LCGHRYDRRMELRRTSGGDTRCTSDSHRTTGGKGDRRIMRRKYIHFVFRIGPVTIKFSSGTRRGAREGEWVGFVVNNRFNTGKIRGSFREKTFR
uniref:CAP-Gly domain-containing protein n=1 Tax=Rodentolepis nana TaxID=102285 RepID=A0A0R3TRA0_RODNA